jgi:hypothetical protein
MAGIQWNEGRPPEAQRGKRLLLIASPTNVNFDSATDNRPDICVGHFHAADVPNPVPARFSGMSASEARPELNVHCWAEIDLPPGAELRALTVDDLKG